MELRYDTIERQLAEAIPELQPSANYYWNIEGTPGTDSGPYIFFESMFGCFVNLLLMSPPSGRRDDLLRQCFGFVERMLASPDERVRDLAFIGLYEGKSAGWLRAAASFVGPGGLAELNRQRPGWRRDADMGAAVPELQDIIDLYRVREILDREIRA